MGMLESGEGLILRTRLLTETSLIVRWLGAEQGLVSCVAKGARRNESPFRGKLDLGFVCRFAFVRSRRSDLHTLREAVVSRDHRGLREDYDRLAAFAYAVRLLEAFLEPETPVPAVLDLALEFTEALCARGVDTGVMTLFFEMKLLGGQGLWDPSLLAGASPGVAAASAFALEHPLNDLGVLGMDRRQRLELHGVLLRLWEGHLGFVPKGHPCVAAMA